MEFLLSLHTLLALNETWGLDMTLGEELEKIKKCFFHTMVFWTKVTRRCSQSETTESVVEGAGAPECYRPVFGPGSTTYWLCDLKPISSLSFSLIN